MKKIYKTIIVAFFLFLSTNSYSVIHTITVSNFQFSPASLSVNVGDTMLWVLGGGNHTTTSDGVLPNGAAPWDSPINSTVPAFSYVVTVEGTYNYICSPHLFQGQFVAINTGISNPVSLVNFNIYSIRKSIYNISYSLNRSTDVRMTIYDITGKSARVLSSTVQPAGDYSKTFNLEDLQNGIYLFEILIGNQRISKRLILD